MALYYALSASLILFANILSNPQDQHAAFDILLMNLMTSFINQSVRPGTPFAATPTLTMFQELYSITTRLVAKVTPRTSQKTKRVSESDDPSQSGQLVSDMSLFSDSKAQVNTPLVSSLSGHTFLNMSSSSYHIAYFKHSHNTHQILREETTKYFETQQLHQGDGDEKPITELSHESIEDSPLEFAPFIPPEQSDFDFYPATYDSLLSPTGFDWDAANMPWPPSFGLDPWLSADVTVPPPDANYDDSLFQ